MPRIGWRLGIACTAVILAGIGLAIGWGNFRRAPDLVQQARSAYTDHDWSRAAELARRRLKAVPEDVEALRVLARATARLGRDVSANALFARLGSPALAAEDLYLLGVGLSRAGQTGQAERVWESALSLDGDHAETLDQLSRLYALGNRPDEAARLAERLASRPGWELPGELIWGSLRSDLSDPAGAAAILRQALDRPQVQQMDRSAVAGYHKLLASVLLRTGRPGEARSVLDGALRNNPDPESYWLLSRAWLLEGANAPAAVALRSAGTYRAEHPLEPEPSPYIGEARCAECHRDVFRAHQASGHASTLVQGQKLADLPYPDQPVSDPDDSAVIHRFLRDGTSIRFESQEGDTVRRAVVAYAFGSPDHYVSLVGPDSQNRPYILRLSHYKTSKDEGWVRTTGHTALAEGDRDFLGKPLDGPDGLFKCLFCHATNPRAVLDQSGPEQHDRAIGCERCHGPGAVHIAAVAAKIGDPAIVSPADAPAEARLRLCGQCHSQHLSLPSPPPRTDPFWIRFQGTTLPWSRCYSESGGFLDCMTCHNPHHDTDQSEARYDHQCLSCHSAQSREVNSRSARAADRVAHGSTCPVNPSTGCVGCHMPRFPSVPLHTTFTDHYIRVHPVRK